MNFFKLDVQGSRIPTTIKTRIRNDGAFVGAGSCRDGLLKRGTLY